VASRTSGPYQATPAFTTGLCASYIHTMRPPQQKPVMPSLAVSALPSPLAKATVESRSPMTCASGTFETMSLISVWMSVMDFVASPWRK
jgi:hypothetical protein